MADRLTKFKELLERLQDAVTWERGLLPNTEAFLDRHAADVTELVTLKGNETVEELLGLPCHSIRNWRIRNWRIRRFTYTQGVKGET